MKFITEMELRDLYKREPFTAYVLNPDTKITPGARQFLVDRRITLTQSQSAGQEAIAEKPLQEPEKWCNLRLNRRMDSIESLFILIAAELLHSGNALLSEEIMSLAKCFRNVAQAEREKTTPDNIQFWGWSAEEIKNRADNLDKFVDISEFHVGLENGREIAMLNYLRASLREVEPAILEAYWNEEKQDCLRQDLIDNVNLIINIICMMMWKFLGGQKWKR